MPPHYLVNWKHYPDKTIDFLEKVVFNIHNAVRGRTTVLFCSSIKHLFILGYLFVLGWVVELFFFFFN